MSQIPVIESSGLGYEPPHNTQFSVFLDNRVGKLAELLHIFDKQATRVAGLSITDSTDHAVVRLVTSREELTRRLLTRNKMPFAEKSVLVVEFTRGQSIGQMCAALVAAELNIHSIYPLLVQPHSLPTIALNIDDPIMATQVLIKKQFMLLGENDLGDNATNSDGTNPRN
ncbi:MAG: hypothetical protein IT444_03215 [Phycisphaeraceae bacterium]|nr:hypothetical protein [Phycisphaeraceae bacterium]